MDYSGCKHKRTETRTKLDAAGVRMVGDQCIDCGAGVGSWWKRETWPDVSTLPMWDQPACERAMRERRRECSRRRASGKGKGSHQTDLALQRAADAVPQVIKMLATGTSWLAAIEACGMKSPTLHRWRRCAQGTPQRAIAERLFDARVVRRIPLTPKDRSEREEQVYVFGSVSGEGCIKIGYTSRNVNQRLAACQTGSPVWLKVLACVRAPRSFEAWLHFALEQDRSHGEWFKQTRRVKAVVAMMSKIGNMHTATSADMAALRRLAQGKPYRQEEANAAK